MRRAVVLLSGGLDSATTLAIARSEGYACHCLTIDYGQRHRAELVAAGRVAAALDAAEQRLLKIDLASIGGSALTDRSIAVPETPSAGIPATYVPARNTIFLALALAWAEVLAAQDMFFGANAIDYSGYPDCRPEYMRAFETLARIATRAGVEGSPIALHTPIISLAKSDIILRGMALGVDYALTVSCYQADAEGRACARCDACRLRCAGFEAAGLADPTRYTKR